MIAPARGMSQAQFDSVMGSIKDDDLAGVTTLSGQPVTAEYLQRSARLESVGDGRYFVLLGSDPMSPVYAMKMEKDSRSNSSSILAAGPDAVDEGRRRVGRRAPAQRQTSLPATFGDTFDTTWREGLFFSSSIAQLNARTAGLDNYLDEVQQTSGRDIRDEVHSSFDAQQAARDAVAKLKETRPDLQIPDLTDEELDRRAASISGMSHQAFVEMAGREKTFGGKLGMLAGGLVGGVGDPLNLVAAPAAVEAKLGILGSAALWGGFGAGSQAVNEITNAQFRNQAVPGYTQSGAPAENILEAGLGGAALGGLFKGLGNVWTRMKTGEWPRSVRDAGNIVESEANVQSSNVLPGVEGDAAHREALGKAIDDIAAGRPVEAPESASNVARQQSEIMDARDAAMEPALPSPPPPQFPQPRLKKAPRPRASIRRTNSGTERRSENLPSFANRNLKTTCLAPPTI